MTRNHGNKKRGFIPEILLGQVPSEGDFSEQPAYLSKWICVYHNRKTSLLLPLTDNSRHWHHTVPNTKFTRSIFYK